MYWNTMAISTDTFRPCLWKDGAADVIYLPCPIATFVPRFEWKKAVNEVPMTAGSLVDAPSLRGIVISASGQMALNNGTPVIDEADLWDYAIELKDFMNVTDDETLELFVYYDSDTSTYRKFKSVTPDSWQVDQGDTRGNIWSWTGSWLAADTTLYTTAPGA